MIYVGTSGYSYKDWVGTWYPEGTADRDMLGEYAKRFRTVELNFTYYRQPSVRTIEGIVRKLPDHFKLFVKANSETTHKRNREAAKEFKEGVEPARSAGVLAGVLAQFPYSFKNEPASHDYLAQLAEDFAGYNPVVEFRNRAWSKMSTGQTSTSFATVSVSDATFSATFTSMKSLSYFDQSWNLSGRCASHPYVSNVTYASLPLPGTG